MPEPSAAPPGTYAGATRSPVVYVYLCPSCAGYPPITAEDYSGALSGGCNGCGNPARELHRFPAVIVSAAGCACRTSHQRATGDLPDVHELTMAVQQAWDAEFSRPSDRAVDYRQARAAVQTALGLGERGAGADV
jgi:hypothetical protein